MNAPVQLSLFTVRGHAYSEAQERTDLRVKVMEAMGEVYGAIPIPIEDGACLECGGPLVVVPHLTCPTAYCECGYLLDLSGIDEEEEAQP